MSQTWIIHESTQVHFHERFAYTAFTAHTCLAEVSHIDVDLQVSAAVGDEVAVASLEAERHDEHRGEHHEDRALVADRACHRMRSQAYNFEAGQGREGRDRARECWRTGGRPPELVEGPALGLGKQAYTAFGGAVHAEEDEHPSRLEEPWDRVHVGVVVAAAARWPSCAAGELCYLVVEVVEAGHVEQPMPIGWDGMAGLT
jgi:hypothetical protein